MRDVKQKLMHNNNILFVTMPSTQTMLPRNREVSVRGVTCLLPKLNTMQTLTGIKTTQITAKNTRNLS